MSTTQDFKTTFKYNLTFIFLSLRAQLKKPLCPWTPCSYFGLILICCLHLTLVPGARIGKKYDKGDQLIGETFPFSIATLLRKANQFLAK